MTIREEKMMRIFVGEADKWENEPLYMAIIELCRERGIKGATALRGIAGYGLHNRVHTDRILRLSGDLPVVVEVIDREDKLKEALPELEKMIGDGLITFETVEVFGKS